MYNLKQRVDKQIVHPIAIRTISPRDQAVQDLIQELDAYQASLYPAESNHLDPVEELEKQHVYFVGAFEGNRLLGCGAVKLMAGGYGEIKRMYVLPQARGHGVGRCIMEALENFLLESNVRVARLETGIYQSEAIALYTKRGYREIAPFGAYGDDPLSIFMERSLA